MTILLECLMKIHTLIFINSAASQTQTFLAIFFCNFVQLFTINYRSSLQYETNNTEYKNVQSLVIHIIQQKVVKCKNYSTQ